MSVLVGRGTFFILCINIFLLSHAYQLPIQISHAIRTYLNDLNASWYIKFTTRTAGHWQVSGCVLFPIRILFNFFFRIFLWFPGLQLQPTTWAATWVAGKESFLDNSFRFAGWQGKKKVEGLLAKYPLAFGKSVRLGSEDHLWIRFDAHGFVGLMWLMFFIFFPRGSVGFLFIRSMVGDPSSYCPLYFLCVPWYLFILSRFSSISRKIRSPNVIKTFFTSGCSRTSYSFRMLQPISSASDSTSWLWATELAVCRL